jgi:hypothetical protein
VGFANSVIDEPNLRKVTAHPDSVRPHFDCPPLDRVSAAAAISPKARPIRPAKLPELMADVGRKGRLGSIGLNKHGSLPQLASASPIAAGSYSKQENMTEEAMR